MRKYRIVVDPTIPSNEVHIVDDNLQAEVFRMDSGTVTITVQTPPENLSSRWRLLRKIKHGHKIFHDCDTGLIAVADDSGLTPDLTDDGILYLDRSRPINLSFGRRTGNYISVPVFCGDSHQLSHMSEPVDGALWLAVTFGLDVYVEKLGFISVSVSNQNSAVKPSASPVGVKMFSWRTCDE